LSIENGNAGVSNWKGKERRKHRERYRDKKWDNLTGTPTEK